MQIKFCLKEHPDTETPWPSPLSLGNLHVLGHSGSSGPVVPLKPKLVKPRQTPGACRVTNATTLSLPLMPSSLSLSLHWLSLLDKNKGLYYLPCSMIFYIKSVMNLSVRQIEDKPSPILSNCLQSLLLSIHEELDQTNLILVFLIQNLIECLHFPCCVLTSGTAYVCHFYDPAH